MSWLRDYRNEPPLSSLETTSVALTDGCGEVAYQFPDPKTFLQYSFNTFAISLEGHSSRRDFMNVAWQFTAWNDAKEKAVS
jgi:hypothetical protein